ncbi:MAG: chemotaxis-specific protein-glutamate methyltransferase CheB [Nitrospira sp.]|nr:chemotaxis-specific protein-glutamate methyltransferase CheB [Nitrospira sp.]
MIRVLIVDDSRVTADYLASILNSDPDIEIMDIATSAEEAFRAVRKYKPDVITMDIVMPVMDGFQATLKIMQTDPTPIVIVSNYLQDDEVHMIFTAMEAGALAVIEKPRGHGHPDFIQNSEKLIQMVKLMSEVKVVRRLPIPENKSGTDLPAEDMRVLDDHTKVQAVVIGASTGGPVVLQTILSKLPNDFPVPVLIVQHITAGFLKGFQDWLSQTAGPVVHVAVNGQELLPGHVYIAPDNYHMEIGKNGRIILSDEPADNGLKPSVSYLFRTALQFYGSQLVGVLLTGMGVDGAKDLKAMKDSGCITIAQDETSSVVHGMPGEAVKLDGASFVLPPDKIVTLLKRLVKRQ